MVFKIEDAKERSCSWIDLWLLLQQTIASFVYSESMHLCCCTKAHAFGFNKSWYWIASTAADSAAKKVNVQCNQQQQQQNKKKSTHTSNCICAFFVCQCKDHLIVTITIDARMQLYGTMLALKSCWEEKEREMLMTGHSAHFTMRIVRFEKLQCDLHFHCHRNRHQQTFYCSLCKNYRLEWNTKQIDDNEVTCPRTACWLVDGKTSNRNICQSWHAICVVRCMCRLQFAHICRNQLHTNHTHGNAHRNWNAIQSNQFART